MPSASCRRGASRYKVGHPPPPTVEDTPSPPAVEGKVVEGCSLVVCAPSPVSGSASVVVHEPTGAHVLLSTSQMSETRSSSIQVVLPQRIPYAMWHGKVAKSFKARQPELAALGLGPVVPSRHRAHLVGKDRRGSISFWLLMPHV
jgi:hypothetical protein